MTDIDFAGQVAIITGAGRGLGREYARLLAERHARVVVNDIAGAEEAAAEIRAAGGEAIADSSDISTAEGGFALVDAAVSEWGTLDILVNNAAVGRWASFTDTTAEDFDLVQRVGLYGTFNVTKAAWPIFSEKRYGRIIMTSSGHGSLGGASAISYSTMKGGVYGMMRAAAIDGQPLGILVNAIAPAAFTPLAQQYVSEDFADVMKEQLPTRLVSPLVAVLASRELTDTGKFFDVGGGRVGRTFSATTPGFYDPELSPESLRDHWSEVQDESEHSVFFDSSESFSLLALAKQKHAEHASGTPAA